MRSESSKTYNYSDTRGRSNDIKHTLLHMSVVMRGVSLSNYKSSEFYKKTLRNIKLDDEQNCLMLIKGGRHEYDIRTEIMLCNRPNGTRMLDHETRINASRE